jgi:hypothetical protein
MRNGDSVEQLEEIQARFEEMTPRIHADGGFQTGVAQMELEEGDDSYPYFPFVYLATDETEGKEMPSRYIYVIKTGDDAFHVRLAGMAVLLGVGVPAKWWPTDVSAAELDEVILHLWELWFSLNEAYRAEIESYKKLLNPPNMPL